MHEQLTKARGGRWRHGGVRRVIGVAHDDADT